MVCIYIYRLYVCIDMYICIDLSIYLSIYLSVYLSIYLSIHLSIYLSIHPSIHLSIYVIKSNLYIYRLVVGHVLKPNRLSPIEIIIGYTGIGIPLFGMMMDDVRYDPHLAEYFGIFCCWVYQSLPHYVPCVGEFQRIRIFLISRMSANPKHKSSE